MPRYAIFYEWDNKTEYVRTRTKNIKKFSSKKLAEKFAEKYKKRRKIPVWVEKI